jgi:hypothetical protein
MQGGKGIFFPSYSQCVPMGFSKSSSTFQVVPQDVPNSTLVLSLMVCQKFNSNAYRLKRWAIWEDICFYFETWGPKNHFNWGVPNVQILLDDGLINMDPSKKNRERERKRKGVGAPMIIQITLWPTDNKGCGQLHHHLWGKRIKFWTKDMRQNMVLLRTTDYSWV